MVGSFGMKRNTGSEGRASPFFLLSQVNLGKKKKKRTEKKIRFTVSGSFGIKGNTCSQEFLLSSFFPKSSSNEKTASYQTLESSLQKLAAAADKILLIKSFGGLFLTLTEEIQ